MRRARCDDIFFGLYGRSILVGFFKGGGGKSRSEPFCFSYLCAYARNTLARAHGMCIHQPHYTDSERENDSLYYALSEYDVVHNKLFNFLTLYLIFCLACHTINLAHF